MFIDEHLGYARLRVVSYFVPIHRKFELYPILSIGSVQPKMLGFILAYDQFWQDLTSQPHNNLIILFFEREPPYLGGYVFAHILLTRL